MQQQPVALVTGRILGAPEKACMFTSSQPNDTALVPHKASFMPVIQPSTPSLAVNHHTQYVYSKCNVQMQRMGI